jgi:Reverse transcriptase (RNA-dependent DNA polymerase)/Endonuclease-reverse transcriptase
MLTSFVAFLLLTVESNPGPLDVHFGSLNARSAGHKAALIHDLICDNKLDVLAVCESWIQDDAPDAIKSDIAPSNYSVLHVHRPRSVVSGRSRVGGGGGGGGLALIYSNDMSARPLKTEFSPKSFELQLVSLQVSRVVVKVANIYRPPDSSKMTFLEEFADMLTTIGLGMNERLVVCGDFNMPALPGDGDGCIDGRLSTLLNEHGYQQHVTGPTRGGNLLDLLITSSSSAHPLVSNVAIRSSHGLSDHDVVVCDLSVRRYKPAAISYSYRNIRNVDPVDFERRLRSSRLFTAPDDSPDGFLCQIELTVTTILDEVAPLRRGTRAGGVRATRWLDADAVAAKKQRRRLERRWKKFGHEIDRVAYRAACRRANALINGSRNRCRYQRVVDAGRDTRRVWSAVKDLLYTNHRDVMTSATDADKAFCSTLATFFVNKVRDIKSHISMALTGQLLHPLSFDQSFGGVSMSEFTPVTEDEVVRLLKSLSSKSSPLDFVPTSLVKSCCGAFATIIARLANLSFERASFPSRFRTAQVTPLLKKHGLDVSDPANYRPISNLNTISKVLERLVLARIVPHVAASPSFDAFQSAYRRHHSTETALLKITDDIFAGFDDRQSTILVALDQSAAFDCVDHDTLFSRLHQTFGLSGRALSWVRSYLTERSSFVRWKGCSSSAHPLDTGVPQGSVLGPLLFSLYIAPLSSVISSFGVRHHQYADDTQMYIAASRTDLSAMTDRLENCAAAVHSWLQTNGLQLNPSKSEVVQFTAARGRDRVDDVATLRISAAVIHPSTTTKSLGVTLDGKLSFDQHVTTVCRSCYHHIRALRHVRESLPDDVARIVACSMVGSRLDYCNALFAGMSASNVYKLQRVQNTLARVLLHRRRFDHITPALKELHWLPIVHRVTFKLASLAYTVRASGQPSYLRELIQDYEPARTLRSSTKHLLCETGTRTVLASRGFRHSAAAAWNSLPDHIRICPSFHSFKRQLKAHLFYLSFAA